jgi:hypothetical protein
MKSNLALADRIIRIISAVVVLVLYSMNVISGTLAIVLIVATGILLITSLINFCPIYWILGIKSKKA